MRWVTWEQVGVDPMACAWLISGFIDREAEFIFIPAGVRAPGNLGRLLRCAAAAAPSASANPAR